MSSNEDMFLVECIVAEKLEKLKNRGNKKLDKNKTNLIFQLFSLSQTKSLSHWIQLAKQKSLASSSIKE